MEDIDDDGPSGKKGEPKLVTFGRAAQIFGVRPTTISEVATLMGIKPYPFPMNGRAKGLDQKMLNRMARALGVDLDKVKIE
jgi:hypothetical protein